MREAAPNLAELFRLRGPDRAWREARDGTPLDVQLNNVSRKLTGFATPPAAGNDMAQYVETMLQSTVGKIFATAWNKRKEILKYGDTAQYPIGQKPSYVALAPHDVKWNAKAEMRVTINATIQKTIPIEIEGKFHVDGAELSIRDTRIMSMRTGKSWFEGKITAGPVELVKQKSDDYVFPGEISFGDGLQIPPPKPAS